MYAYVFICHLYSSVTYLSIYHFLGTNSCEVAKLHSVVHGAILSLAYAQQVCFMHICVYF